MAQFRTEDFAAPHKYGEGGGAPDFDTFHMEAPVKMGGPGATATATAPPANPVPTSRGGTTSMHAAPSYGSLGPMKQGLVIADLVLRSLAALALIIGLAVLAAASQTAALSNGLTPVDTTVTFSVSPNTKYGLSACIIGAIYSIYQVVSTCFRLFTKKPLLPGNISTIVAYVGDQVILILLLSGGAAVAAFLKDIHDQGYCMSSLFPTFCNQVAGATSMLFIAFALVLASFQITAYSFYKNRI